MRHEKLLRSLELIRDEVSLLNVDDRRHLPHNFRLEVQELTCELYEEIYKNYNAKQIENRLAALLHADIDGIILLLQKILAGSPVDYRLSPESKTDIASELNIAIEKCKEWKKCGENTEWAIFFDRYTSVDTAMWKALMGLPENSPALPLLADMIGKKLLVFQKDQVFSWWANIKYSFAENNPYRLKKYSDLVSEDFFDTHQHSEVVKRISEFLSRIGPLTERRMRDEGTSTVGVSFPSPAWIIGKNSKSISMPMRNIDSLVAIAFCNILAGFEALTNEKPEVLAQSVGLDSAGVFFHGRFKDFVEKVLVKLDAVGKLTLLIAEFKKAIHYLECEAPSSPQIVSSLIAFKNGQEVDFNPKKPPKGAAKKIETEFTKSVCKFLLERGIHACGTSFGRNNTDLVHRVETGEVFVIETKLYDKTPTDSTIKNNISQLITYMDDVSKSRGVLLMFNRSKHTFVCENEWVFDGRVLLLAVNLCPSSPSKRASIVRIFERRVVEDNAERGQLIVSTV